MSQPFSQSITFTLDKAYLQECFEQSTQPVESKDYRKAVIIGAIGIALMFVEAEHYYVPFFLIGLAILEVFSVLYRQTWWVWRQLMGKSANSQVKLTIDEKGIITKSEHVNTQLLWSEVNSIEVTEKGIVLVHQGGKNYLSNGHLNEEIVNFILKQKR